MGASRTQRRRPQRPSSKPRGFHALARRPSGTPETSDSPPPFASRTLERLGALPLWAHLAVLGVAAIALVPVTKVLVTGWVDDESLYAAEVQALRDGGWEYPYAGASFDPDGDFFPLVRTDHIGKDFYPYTKHPVYVLALYGAVQTFGTGFGYAAIPVAGLLLAAVAAWLLAAEFERRVAPLAFWLVAVSPLLFNAYVLWAHTLSAAVAGFTALAGVRILKRDLSVLNGVGLVGAMSFGILLRSEAVLFAIAVTVGLSGFLALQRRFVSAVLIGGLGAAATAVTVALELRLIRGITGGGAALGGIRYSSAGRSTVDVLLTRLRAVGRVLFSGSAEGSFSTARSQEFIVYGLLLVGVAALAFRIFHRNDASLIGMAALVVGIPWAVTLYQQRFAISHVARTEALGGLFAAWPIALFGLVVFPWRAAAAGERFVIVMTAIFAAGVFATQYDEGGAAEWGGRFLSPTVVPLSAFVAIALGRCLRDRRWRQRWLAVPILGALALYPATRAITTLDDYRSAGEPIRDSLASMATRAVVFVDAAPALTPTYVWNLGERLEFYVPRGDRPERLLEALYEHRYDNVILVRGPGLLPSIASPYPRTRDVTPKSLAFWKFYELSRLDRPPEEKN